MLTLSGRGIYGGIAMGRLFFHRRQRPVAKKISVQEPAVEIERFWRAHAQAVSQVKEIYQNAIPTIGHSNAMIFHAHRLILEDTDFTSMITRMIQKEKINAEYAVRKVSRALSRTFESMEDPYMRARASDVQDISDRLLRILTNHPIHVELPHYPVILAAEDLAPSETVHLNKEKVLALVTIGGSPLSHTSILAKNMDIPAVIGVGKQLQTFYDSAFTIVDGFHGKIYLDPDPATINIMMQKKQVLMEKRQELEHQIGKESITLDGHKMQILANIGNASHVDSALRADADGIGLFRSEFLYLESHQFPTEEQQLEAYRSVLEPMSPRKVIIRTLDVGADKQASYFHLPHEQNPALGYRAIRICLTQPKIFHTQLRALYRASVYGNLAIMFPMITSLEEIAVIKEQISRIQAELTEENIPFNPDIELGIMIETPAAALISDQLAKEVDFFSIGTNDLTQYLLAIDRQNPMLEHFYRPHHLAVLRTIEMVTQNAHKNGIWVGICGELGGDLSLTETFLAMGIDELSVSSSLVLPLRKKVRETDTRKIRDKVFSDIPPMPPLSR